jgi:hypothetical protein
LEEDHLLAWKRVLFYLGRGYSSILEDDTPLASPIPPPITRGMKELILL